MRAFSPHAPLTRVPADHICSEMNQKLSKKWFQWFENLLVQPPVVQVPTDIGIQLFKLQVNHKISGESRFRPSKSPPKSTSRVQTTLKSACHHKRTLFYSWRLYYIVSLCPENRDFVPNSGKLWKQPDKCPENRDILVFTGFTYFFFYF